MMAKYLSLSEKMKQGQNNDDEIIEDNKWVQY
jgi:hypothetical protein